MHPERKQNAHGEKHAPTETQRIPDGNQKYGCTGPLFLAVAPARVSPGIPVRDLLRLKIKHGAASRKWRSHAEIACEVKIDRWGPALPTLHRTFNLDPSMRMMALDEDLKPLWDSIAAI